MPICNDCIHFHLCSYNTYKQAKYFGKDEEVLITLKNNVTCKFFIESSYIKLPFKVGDMIFVPFKTNRFSSRKYDDIMPLRILAIGSTVDNPDYFVSTDYCKFKITDYRKRFFTLLKEAENALKEGVDNAE